MNPIKLAIVRHILGYAGGLLGGWVIAQGYITAENWEVVQGNLSAILLSALGGGGALAWSLREKQNSTLNALKLPEITETNKEVNPQTIPDYFTAEVLRAAGWSLANTHKFLPHLRTGASLYGINTPLRIAHFVAQISHESACGLYTREIWDGKGAQARYDTRTDLGNTPERDGDGFHNRGVGLIQNTGETNIEEALAELGYPPDSNDNLAMPEGASLSACFFWYKHGLNEIADRSGIKVDRCTRVVNGGYNGLEERQQYFDRVMSYYASVYL